MALSVCVSLLWCAVARLGHAAAATQSLEQRAGRPRPGKPEGSWPNLDEVQCEGDPARAHERAERTGPPPIPSTMRSPKVPLHPWNGRRVGDVEPQVRVDRSVAQTLRSRMQGSAAPVR
ncbi:MAG TPA: hypothetical protein VLB87_16150, partial [Pyrinomonadaceae bacterium]|nr:hypothetical protein [Pyrinomonadaceae bacterium]